MIGARLDTGRNETARHEAAPNDGARAGASDAVAEGRSLAARIHLAASELEREAATPRVAAIAARLRDATRELAAWSASLGVLARRAPARRTARLDTELRALHARIAPVLRARGVRWSAPTGVPASCGLDAGDLRRCLCELVRAGAAATPDGGPVSTDVEIADGTPRLTLALGLAPDAAASAFDAPAWRALADELGALGAHLSLDADAARARVAFPAEEVSPCRAS